MTQNDSLKEIRSYHGNVEAHQIAEGVTAKIESPVLNVPWCSFYKINIFLPLFLTFLSNKFANAYEKKTETRLHLVCLWRHLLL